MLIRYSPTKGIMNYKLVPPKETSKYDFYVLGTCGSTLVKTEQKKNGRKKRLYNIKTPAEAVGFLRVNKNPQHVGGAWMFVCCDCCVLSGRGLCDELITRSEESYRLWCVVVCDLETS